MSYWSTYSENSTFTYWVNCYSTLMNYCWKRVYLVALEYFEALPNFFALLYGDLEGDFPYKYYFSKSSLLESSSNNIWLSSLDYFNSLISLSATSYNSWLNFYSCCNIFSYTTSGDEPFKYSIFYWRSELSFLIYLMDCITDCSFGATFNRVAMFSNA